MAARILRDIGNRDVYWTPYAEIDGIEQSSETCGRPPGEAFCRRTGVRDYEGLSASRISYGVRCDTTWGSCDGGSTLHHVWSLILSASVTLDDYQPPTTTGLSTPLDDAQWHRGPGTFTVSTSDNTGVRVLRLLEGATVRASRTAPGAAAGGCGELNTGEAYTYVQPCGGARGLNGSQTVSVAEVCAWGDGAHRLRASALDTGGLEGTGPETVTVRADCTAPSVTVGPATRTEVIAGQPVEPTVTATDAHVAVASTEVQVQRNADGDWEPYTGSILGALGHAYRFRARGTDALGNRSAWSGPSAYTVVVRAAEPAPASVPTGGAEAAPAPDAADPATSPGAPPDGSVPPRATPLTAALTPLTPVGALTGAASPRHGARAPVLIVTRVKRTGRRVRIAGRAEGVVAGSLTARLELRLTDGTRRRRTVRSLAIRDGRYSATLTMTRFAAPAGVRRATLVLTARTTAGAAIRVRRAIA